MAELPSLQELISLKGQCALITGAASGIGKAITRRYAEAGARLILVDKDAERLAETQTELSCYGTEIETHTVNLLHKSEIDQLWAKLGRRTPTILVHNAGIYVFKPLLEVDEAFYRQSIDVNLSAVYWMCQAMIRAREKDGGIIINIGSIEAVMPFAEELSHYSMSKAGVITLTRALAREYARQGFRINVILPGGIITEGTKSTAKEIFSLKFGLFKTGWNFFQRLPTARMGQPDDVARMALVLASDLTSYVHGAVFTVDGGFLSA